MSVTFASRTPAHLMAKAQFGNQQQTKANVAQFGNTHNPANNVKAGAAPQFGWICTTACCIGATPLLLIGGIITAVVFGVKGLFRLFKGG